jgi:hypothetical protein
MLKLPHSQFAPRTTLKSFSTKCQHNRGGGTARGGIRACARTGPGLRPRPRPRSHPPGSGDPSSGGQDAVQRGQCHIPHLDAEPSGQGRGGGIIPIPKFQPLLVLFCTKLLEFKS